MDRSRLTREEHRSDRDGLAREVEALREENARLRALLGLDTRSGGGHEIAWAPTLPMEPSASVGIDATASDVDRVALLRWLFGARSDVYAVRWENASSGKTGWSPATRGGWSKRRSAKDYLPLTDDVFAAHLNGTATVGIYALLRGDGCALLACDFDKAGWALDALAYLDVCHDHGVPAVLERSRSGDGAHVWVFFDGVVAASEARAMGAALLRLAMAKRAELDLAPATTGSFPLRTSCPRRASGT